MSLLATLCDYLQAQGFGAPGDTLFIGLMAQNVDNGILLRSPLQGIAYNYEMPGYFARVHFQMIVRCQDFAVGYDLATRASQALTLVDDSTSLPGYKINYLRPRHEPVSYPLSAGNNLEFSVNFDVNYVIVQQ